MTGPAAPGRRRSTVFVTVVAALPLLVAAVRGLTDGWHPIGDNAFFSLRAADVGTEHNPLLGTWTSASLTLDRTLHNPGPLLFDLLALPVRVGPVGGTIVGIVALHLAALVLSVRWAARAAGELGAGVVAAAFAALFFAMGSALLVEPWQPHSLLPASLAYVVLVWVVVAGHPGALPWAAGAGSLLVQTHLSYAVLVPGLAALAVAAVVVRARRGDAPSARGAVVVSGLLLGLLWAMPLYEQVTGSGNLVAVVTEGGGGERVAGLGFAARVLGTVGAVPGGWTHSGFAAIDGDLLPLGPDGDPTTTDALAGAGAVAGWSAVAALAVAAVAVVTWRRRDGAWGSALLVAAAATGLAFVTVAALPISPVLGVAAHQIRLVWPVVLFAMAVVLGSALRTVPAPRWVVPAAVVGLALLGIPARNAETGPAADAWAMPVVRDLTAQLDPLERAGLVYVDLSVLRFAEPYSTPVLLELRERGIDFRVDDESAHQVGLGRRVGPDDDIDLVIRVVEGDAARDPEPGWERIAFVPGDTGRETAAVLSRVP